MRGDQFDGIQFDQRYDFALPRIGATWTPRPSLSAFASWAYSSREPAFRDLYDAEGAGSVPLYGTIDVASGIYEDPLIRPERVNDFEVGGAWRGEQASASLNLFRMDFHDELVFFGQYDTDLGYAIIGNAAQSVHQGIEAAARAARPLTADLSLTLDANATLSDNHFVHFSEVFGPAPSDVVSHDGKAISMFPSVLANLSARLDWRTVRLGAEVQHTGRIYLDNTEQVAASIEPHTVLNLIGGVRLARGDAGSVLFQLRVNNALDLEYETSGYMDFDAAGNLTPRYIPAATRNVLGEVRVEW
jgi:outer membrane receptor protein involved in Fe transport